MQAMLPRGHLGFARPIWLLRTIKNAELRISFNVKQKKQQ